MSAGRQVTSAWTSARKWSKRQSLKPTPTPDWWSSFGPMASGRSPLRKYETAPAAVIYLLSARPDGAVVGPSATKWVAPTSFVVGTARRGAFHNWIERGACQREK